MENLTELISLSRRFGSDSAFVLAGGGNTSLKLGNRLWVKASGHALATIDADGFVELDRDVLQEMLTDQWPVDAQQREALFVDRVLSSRVHPEQNQRPSVEALLHHLLPDKLVVHTHPGCVNALTCCIRGQEQAMNHFGNDLLWQPYVDPGLTLAKALQKNLAAFDDAHARAPRAIFLENHGFIIGGETAEAVEAVTKKLVDQLLHTKCDDQTPDDSDHHLLKRYQRALESLAPGHVTAIDDSEAIRWIVTTAAGKAAAMGGPVTPDQIVYCRSFPLWIDASDISDDGADARVLAAIEDYEREHAVTPWVFLVAGAGVIAMRDSAKLANITRDVYVDAAAVMRKAQSLGGVRPLKAADRRFIETWEVEAYRRSIAARISQQ